MPYLKPPLTLRTAPYSDVIIENDDFYGSVHKSSSARVRLRVALFARFVRHVALRCPTATDGNAMPTDNNGK